ncbi:MAG TPA: endonuclease domain-containing protein [Anaerolineaceae bacterium]|nr:endonuclease domain-containing protein [Anaerolineaceae bacterium]
MTKSKLTPLAQILRREATREEQRLWYDFLSTYPARFRRQVVIGKYVVDFYCSSARLAIELDGGQHYKDSALIRDNERTQWLQDSGILVLRFLNSDVRNNLSDVCSSIDTVVKERLEEMAN